MQKITPFLWFDDQAEEAAKFYTSIFSKSRIGKIARYDKQAAKKSGRPAGSAMTVEFQLEGQMKIKHAPWRACSWFLAWPGSPAPPRSTWRCGDSTPEA